MPSPGKDGSVRICSISLFRADRGSASFTRSVNVLFSLVVMLNSTIGGSVSGDSDSTSCAAQGAGIETWANPTTQLSILSNILNPVAKSVSL